MYSIYSKIKHGQLVNYQELFEKSITADNEFMDGIEIKGESNQEITTGSAKECMDRCKEDTTCYLWVFNESKCFLKDKPKGKTVKKGAVSGFIKEKYVCVREEK